MTEEAVKITETDIFKRRVEIYFIGFIFIACGIIGALILQHALAVVDDWHKIPKDELAMLIFWVAAGVALPLGLWTRAGWARAVAVTVGFLTTFTSLLSYVIQTFWLRDLNYRKCLLEESQHWTVLGHLLAPCRGPIALALPFVLIIIFMFRRNRRLATQSDYAGDIEIAVQPIPRTGIILTTLLKYLLILAGVVIAAKLIDMFVTGIV